MKMELSAPSMYAHVAFVPVLWLSLQSRLTLNNWLAVIKKGGDIKYLRLF
jgi:hypothetical protein